MRDLLEILGVVIAVTLLSALAMVGAGAVFGLTFGAIVWGWNLLVPPSPPDPNGFAWGAAAIGFLVGILLGGPLVKITRKCECRETGGAA